MKTYLFSSIVGLIVLTMVQSFAFASDSTKLQVYFLDVGQGDSALIKYPTGEKMLIDTGKDSKVFRSLDQVLPWYDKTIDYVLLTHGDLDHVGAMLDLIDRYEIKKVFVSEFFGEIEVEQKILIDLKKENADVEVLEEGDTLTFGSEISNSFEILHPDTNCFVVYKNENDCSLVGLLTYGSKSFLFTGDVGSDVELELIDKIKEPVSVLKVGHHGSKYSSNSLFLEKIKPQYSVISSGTNSYGHPHPDTIKRLTQASTTIFNTKEDATVVASSDGTSLEVKRLFDQTSFFKSSVCSILLYGFDTSC